MREENFFLLQFVLVGGCNAPPPLPLLSLPAKEGEVSAPVSKLIFSRHLLENITTSQGENPRKTLSKNPQ